jgi:hypothetical protein
MVSQVNNQREFQIKEFKDIVGPSAEEHERVIENHHYKFLWTFIVNGILGLLLCTGPFLFDYHSSHLVLSDIISGGLIILLESLSFDSRRAHFRWATLVVAFWLLFAPLVFWSPTPAVFVLDTLIACLVISFALLVPGTPGKAGVEMPGPDKPPGWTYNPSSWIRRWLGIALALLGFIISRYLAAHQLGYINHAWDPFFGDGTDKVTGSAISKSFPISDAGFGSVAYVLETLAGFMGDRARWRTSPWIAVIFAILVIPLGVTSVVLVITQPVLVGAWCGLCLISAAALLTSVPLAVHEAVAVGQFLLDARARGKNLWQIFWYGGSIEGGGAPDPDRRRYTLAQRWIESVRGVTVPWQIALQGALGIWLMARPSLIYSSNTSSNCDHLLGALIVTVAAVASAEVTRLARFGNVLFGALLAVGGIVFASNSAIVLGNDILCGVVLIAMSIPRGEIVERYASWDRFVK